MTSRQRTDHTPRTTVWLNSAVWYAECLTFCTIILRNLGIKTKQFEDNSKMYIFFINSKIFDCLSLKFFFMILSCLHTFHRKLKRLEIQRNRISFIFDKKFSLSSMII